MRGKEINFFKWEWLRFGRVDTSFFGTQLEQQPFCYLKKHRLRLSTNSMLAYFRELSVSLHWVFYFILLTLFLFLRMKILNSSCAPISDTAFPIICSVSSY